jgi:formate dehydrogenase accessory protein FdhD
MQATRLDETGRHAVDEALADETAVALYFNGEPFVVLMATAQDLPDLALGYALGEGLVEHPGQLTTVDLLRREGGLVYHCLLAAECSERLRERRRQLFSASGCGLCGAETLRQALRPPDRLRASAEWSPGRIEQAMKAMAAAQTLNLACGGLHAAAALLPGDPIALVLREDVGRHNAVDKVVGALARRKVRAEAMLVTSRASFELVHKTASAGIPLLAAVSAPTSAAIELARRVGLTLLGFVRDGRMTLYTDAR